MFKSKIRWSVSIFTLKGFPESTLNGTLVIHGEMEYLGETIKAEWHESALRPETKYDDTKRGWLFLAIETVEMNLYYKSRLLVRGFLTGRRRKELDKKEERRLAREELEFEILIRQALRGY